MKTNFFIVWWWIVFTIMLGVGIASFCALIGESDDWLVLILSKILAIAGFYITYVIYKWLYNN